MSWTIEIKPTAETQYFRLDSKTRKRIDPRIEPVPISSESYEKDTWIPLIYEIRQKGIELEFA